MTVARNVHVVISYFRIFSTKYYFTWYRKYYNPSNKKYLVPITILYIVHQLSTTLTQCPKKNKHIFHVIFAMTF